MAQQAHSGRHVKPTRNTLKFNSRPIVIAASPPELPSPPPLVVVVYEDGALSVTAEDATLREIFESLHESTGATIETPYLGEERKNVHLGPLAPVQVIAGLLEGTHLNYAILGGTGPTDRVLRIMVMAKGAAGPPALSPGSEEAKARTDAEMHRAETGGDEGVWDPSQTRPPTQGRPALSPQQQRDRMHK